MLIKKWNISFSQSTLSPTRQTVAPARPTNRPGSKHRHENGISPYEHVPSCEMVAHMIITIRIAYNKFHWLD